MLVLPDDVDGEGAADDDAGLGRREECVPYPLVLPPRAAGCVRDVQVGRDLLLELVPSFEVRQSFSSVVRRRGYL